jgi:hypothetical protein
MPRIVTAGALVLLLLVIVAIAVQYAARAVG